MRRDLPGPFKHPSPPEPRGPGAIRHAFVILILRATPESLAGWNETGLDEMAEGRFPQGVTRVTRVTRPRVAPWMGDFAALAIAAVNVAAVLIITFVASYLALSQRRQLKELTSRTEERLSEVDREFAAMDVRLGQMIASTEASQPDFAKRFPELLREDLDRALKGDTPVLALETGAALTRNARELKVDANPELASEIGLGFLKLVDDGAPPPATAVRVPPTKESRLSVPAMHAVEELLTYRSYLLGRNPARPEEGTTAHTAMLKLPELHRFRPFDLTSIIHGPEIAAGTHSANPAARIALLDRPEVVLTEGYQVLIVDGYDLQLDGLDLGNVLFENCTIAYSGGPIALDSVSFLNCKFLVTPRGKSFATATLNAHLGGVTYH